jgi:uncharacterized membrane protein YoaK (UPF0700 family)
VKAADLLKRTLTRKDFIPLLSGLFAALVVILVWRIEQWPYRLETTMAVMFAAITLVSAVRNGRLAKQPVATLFLGGAFAVLGAAIGHL